MIEELSSSLAATFNRSNDFISSTIVPCIDAYFIETDSPFRYRPYLQSWDIARTISMPLKERALDREIEDSTVVKW